MTTLNSKLRLQLLGNKTLQRRSGKGFTLIELMVTVATLGVLGAAAFPAFQSAQAKAAAGSMIGSMQGFAKECATNALLGDVAALNNLDTTVITLTATGTGTNCSTGATLKNASAFDPARVGGMKCFDDEANGSTEKICTLTVTTEGVISGAWSAT